MTNGYLPLRPFHGELIAMLGAAALVAALAAARGAAAQEIGATPSPSPSSAATSATATPTESAATDYEPGRSYLGRLIAPPMHFSGADWLTRSSRIKEENPAKLLKSLALKPGQVVCDFGCGNGYHTLQLAKRVGPQGAVYAVDIQPEMLELLAERAAPRGLENIKPVLATAENAGMPPGTFDLVLMVDVYHELSHPPEVLANVRASLKPEGRLVLVEFREEDGDVPILPLHKMSQTQVVQELTANGFKLASQYDRLPWQHVMGFARDDSPQPAVELVPWKRAE